MKAIRETQAEQTKRYNRWMKYGVSTEWFNQQFDRQEHKCACCSTIMHKENPAGKRLGAWPTMPCIHHSHSYGDIKQLLCFLCNIAEGFLKTPHRAEQLWRYMLQDELFYYGTESARTELKSTTRYRSLTFKPKEKSEMSKRHNEAFRQFIESGEDTCTPIAIKMGVSPGYVSRLANQAIDEGWLFRKSRRYMRINTV